MRRKFNFDEAHRQWKLAASSGHASKDWIDFSTMMFDSFSEIYDTAKTMNEEAMKHRSNMGHAHEALKSIIDAWDGGEVSWMTKCWDALDKCRAAVSEIEASK